MEYRPKVASEHSPQPFGTASFFGMKDIGVTLRLTGYGQNGIKYNKDLKKEEGFAGWED
jgi:hypothetical protein